MELSLALHFRQHPPSPGPEVRKRARPQPALVVFGTDQGMVGQFNESHRSLSRTNYELRWSRLLPLDREWESRLLAVPWPTPNLPELVHDNEGILPAFVNEYLFVSFFRACTESLAAENGARLSAMQRAETNIDDRLRDFRLAFNRQRQKAIDEELFDLQAGFEALTKKPKG